MAAGTVCPGKVNLFLELVARRPDGFHDLESVVVPAPVHDLLRVERTPGSAISVTLSGGAPRLDSIPRDEGNLAVRAAAAVLREAGASRGIALHIEKHIPAGAGLGGGSSDAAGALRAVNELLGDPVPWERLAELAADLGSDVTWFLPERPVAARMTGRGEIVAPVPAAALPPLWLLFPGTGASTAEVYGRCRVPSEGERRSPAAVLDALARGDAESLAAACFNRLAAPSVAVCPGTGDALRALETLHAGRPHVTGSGSTCFLVAAADAVERSEARRLLAAFPAEARMFSPEPEAR